LVAHIEEGTQVEGVFENRVSRRIFGSKKDEVRVEWRQVHNEGLNDLYCSPNIVQVIRSRRMRWAGHVARIGRRREMHTGFWWGNRRERDYLEDPGVDGRIEWNSHWVRALSVSVHEGLKADPPGSPHRAPIEEDAPPPEPYNYLSEFPVQGHHPLTPSSWLATGPLWREIPVSRDLFNT